MLSKIIDNIFFMWYISAVKTLHKRMWWNGRHACLRGKWEIVWVQVPPSAPNANCRAFSSIFCLYKKCSALMPAICLLPTKREIVLQFRSVLSCEVIATKIFNRKNYLVSGLERSVKKTTRKIGEFLFLINTNFR